MTSKRCENKNLASFICFSFLLISIILLLSPITVVRIASVIQQIAVYFWEHS